MDHYRVIVVGGGHAGVEACAACAHMGFDTLLITLNKKMISNMPCNPSIGGSAKGIVVREIDALGGLMGKAADHEQIQMKMLNTGKGPGVQCLRAQEDKFYYPNYMQKLLDDIENLDIVEGMVTKVNHERKKITGVTLEDGKTYYSDVVILATGTYMESSILRGHNKVSGGPDGERPSLGLSKSLTDMGLKLFRLKTGTPPRVKKSSIDFSKAEVENGMEGYLAFSYENKDPITLEGQVPCYLVYTNEKTHKIILDNLDNCATFNGLVSGVGPRYCPSIESKLTTFRDKERHQLFLEPEYKNGESIYIQGFSTSMCEELQVDMVHSLPGLENAEILKYAYAIEYDAFVASQFDATLKIKDYDGLYIAGQICGTSGYEEAGALGLMAGINASLWLMNKDPFILKRNEAYIGVMIDDLITKDIKEPYRLLSSRAEYRLLLRHDNADLRLTPYGYKLGLISDQRFNDFTEKNKNVNDAIEILKTHHLGCGKRTTEYMLSRGFEPLNSGVSGIEFLKRPYIKYSDCVELIPELKDIRLDNTGIVQLETNVKYEGYIKNQQIEADSYAKFESFALPKDIDYMSLNGLRLEARQKLNDVKPMTIGQASRISGVNPSDISVLILLLKKKQL